jgi:rubredoxin
MDLPIVDLMDPGACYQFLVGTLHPDGLRCPTCQRDDALSVHDRHRPPVFDSRCRHCHAVFNAYTGPPSRRRTAPPLSWC